MTSVRHRAQTVRSDTRTVSIPAPPHEVFAFVADPTNLPRWAVGFCRTIHRDQSDPNRWIVTTAHGDLPIRYVTHAELGVIDFHLAPAPGVEAVVFSRVVPNAEGAEYIFTQFQAPGMTDEVFRGQVDTLIEELRVLRSLIGARAACPA